jgi:methionyl aminopeptidase
MALIKTPQEIEMIVEGGRRMGEILEMLGRMAAPGVSAGELDAEAERLIRAAGGVPAFKGYRTRRSDPPFPGTICFSRNEELVHGIPTKEKVIRNGDLVSIDIGMRYPGDKGYFTDTAITVAVGAVSKPAQKLLSVTYEALEEGIRAAQAGASVASIGKAVQAFVNSQGNYGIVRDLVGHGVGHAVHEEPRVPNYYDKMLESWELKPGMVIAIEPMISIGGHEVETAEDQWTISMADGSLSAHAEHTIVITENGPVVATRRPSES